MTAEGVTRMRLLHRRRPFAPLFYTAAAIVAIEIGAGFWLATRKTPVDSSTYPLFVALVATMAATIGWAMAAWVAQRNARVQHTLTLIATRFAQPLFTQQLTLFNNKFGDETDPRVTTAMMTYLSKTEDATDQQVFQSVKYILNYFEFISGGIVAGELDLQIVRGNIRGSMLHYYDKCLPYIEDLRRSDSRTLEHFHELQRHLRDN